MALQGMSAPVALASLAAAIQERYPSVTDEEGVALQLHHNHLPRMMDYGVLDYSAEARVVTDWSIPELGDAIASLQQIEHQSTAETPLD